jgi:hypothetical protein
MVSVQQMVVKLQLSECEDNVKLFYVVVLYLEANKNMLS